VIDPQTGRIQDITQATGAMAAMEVGASARKIIDVIREDRCAS
jgi:hypothetical protein